MYSGKPTPGDHMKVSGDPCGHRRTAVLAPLIKTGVIRPNRLDSDLISRIAALTWDCSYGPAHFADPPAP